MLRPNGVHPDTIGHDGRPVGNAPDEEGLKALGAKMTAANGYANIHGWELYDTTGTTEDWSYNATGGYGYTFEIGPDEFHPPFPKVVDEYLGAGEYAGKGNREAYLAALENTVDTATHSVLAGKAPAGATLRLRKQFSTPTWAELVHRHPEHDDEGGLEREVHLARQPVHPAGGAGQARRDHRGRAGALADLPGRTRPRSASTSTTEFTVTETGTDLLKVDLDWPSPDDLDLEVYKKNADGSLTEVGSSGNSVGEKESRRDRGTRTGRLRARVINFASTSPTYTLTATLFDSTTVMPREVPGPDRELDADLREGRPGPPAASRSWSTVASRQGGPVDCAARW